MYPWVVQVFTDSSGITDGEWRGPGSDARERVCSKTAGGWSSLIYHLSLIELTLKNIEIYVHKKDFMCTVLSLVRISCVLALI